jgi:hypothetical protein
MGVRLRSTETLGGLNFYSTAVDIIDPEAPRRGQSFAAHAATVLTHARPVGDASEAIRTRQLIGQAVGMLVDRFEVSEDRAMYYLVRVAMAAEMKLPDLAGSAVDESNRRAI